MDAYDLVCEIKGPLAEGLYSELLGLSAIGGEIVVRYVIDRLRQLADQLERKLGEAKYDCRSKDNEHG